MNLSAIRQRAAVDAVKWAPKALYSEVVGWGARRRLPASLREPLYRAFARAVGAELSEVELPLQEYETFGAFFARGLQPNARMLPDDPDLWVAPCDGKLADTGSLDDSLITAKGRGFQLASLVVEPELAAALAGGVFATLYLSPRDYHRVHAPTDCELLAVHYVPGTLFPVHPTVVEGIDQIFARNERLILDLRTRRGRLALVMVGACGVGNMRLEILPLESRHFRRSHRLVSWDLPSPIRLARGALLGAFELGSTVILCAGQHVVDILVPPGATVQFGQALGTPRFDLEKA